MKEIKDVKEIQKIGLNILKYVDKICKANNIPYSLCAGTALGAVRHGGFIPWDDDIDIMMTRENYNKFLEIMDKTSSNQFKCIHHPDYYNFFAKVVDTSTKLEENNTKNHPDMGVFVDVFPLDKMKDSMKGKDIKKVYNYQILSSLASSKKFIKSNHGFLRTCLKFCVYLYAKLFGSKHWINKFNKKATKLQNQNTNLIGMYDDYLERTIFNKSMFENFTTIKFEDSEFPIVADYDTYLSQMYGDYMTPPPVEKRVTVHSFKAYKKEQD